MDSDSGVVSVRKLHSAKIYRGKTIVTVGIYEGEKAEEEWQRDVAKYIAVRHPNIVQLCGTAISENIYATIFHDDLIPFRQFLNLHRGSHLETVYIYAYAHVGFHAAKNYFHSAFQHWLFSLHCTFFIRRTTGRICIGLEPGYVILLGPMYLNFGQVSGLMEFNSLNTPDLEAAAIDSLTLEEYHEICCFQFSQRRDVLVCNPITVNLGAVVSCPLGNCIENFVGIAFIPMIKSNLGVPRWNTATSTVADVMEDGWTRLSSSDAVANTTISLRFGYRDSDYWLSQANHVFKHLGISSNFGDYVVLDEISFYLSIPPITADPPEGFLFLCPAKDFQIGRSLFTRPDCPAYWSLDPAGVERLSTDDAAILGFPSLQLRMIFGSSWDATIYAGLRQFHQAKGFNPESQDVARYLGCPLCQLSSDTTVSFAHKEDVASRSITEPGKVLESANAYDDGDECVT